MVYQTKKTRTPRESSQPPFWPKWANRAQNSLNVVNPWPVHVYRIWSGSAAFCRTYSGKIDFSAQKVNTIMLSAYTAIMVELSPTAFYRHKSDDCDWVNKERKACAGRIYLWFQCQRYSLLKVFHLVGLHLPVTMQWRECRYSLTFKIELANAAQQISSGVT